MPKYRFPLNNGKSLVLEGDAPPSDADVEAEAKKAGVQLMPAEAAKPQSDQVTATMSSQPRAEAPVSQESNDMPIGVMAALGSAVKGVGEGVERLGPMIGTAMRNSPGRAVKALSAATGASVGAGVGASVGHPFAGASLGADVGRRVANDVLIPAQKAGGKLLKFATESGYAPEIYEGLGARTALRKGAQYGLKRVIPGVGNALLAADVGRGAYALAKPVAEKSGATDLWGKLAAHLIGNPDQYDELVTALHAAEAAKHKP